MVERQWNKGLPPVDCPVLVHCFDGTVWLIRRGHWVASYNDDPHYVCEHSGYEIPFDAVIGWSYP